MRQPPAVIRVFDDPEPATAIELADCGSAKMEMTYTSLLLNDNASHDVPGPTISQVINDKTFVHTVFVVGWAGVGVDEQVIEFEAELYVDGVIMNQNDVFTSSVGWDNKLYGTKEIPYIALVDEGVGIHTYSWRIKTVTSPVVALNVKVRQSVWSVCTASPRTVWHEESGSGG